MRDEFYIRQELDRRETRRLLRARLLQLPLDRGKRALELNR
jgi:hypothetical protein